VEDHVKRRVVGTVLVGLGVLFIVFAAGLPLYVAPAVTKLPYDMKACPKPPAAQPAGCLKPSIVEASNAKFLQIKVTNGEPQIDVKSGTLRTTVEVLPQAKITADEQKNKRLTDDAVVWDVYQTVIWTETNEVISASSTELAMNRASGAAINWSGQWLNDSGEKDTTIAYTDQVYKFPFGTEKKDYKYFDSDLRSAPTAKFVDATQVEGVDVYHFTETIPDTAVTVDPDSIAVLLGRFAPDAKSGTVYYRNTRDLWVEPTTGAFIKVRERPHQELRPDTGSPVTLLDADFVTTQETMRNNADSAGTNKQLLKTVNLYGPVGLGLVGLVLIIGGFLLMRSRPSTPAEL
jgi:hypothetical protein